MNLFSMVVVVLAAFCVAGSTVLLKKNIEFLTFSSWFRSGGFIAGLFLYGLGNLLVIFALRANDISVVFPVTSLQYAFAAFLARCYLRERLSQFTLLAISCILLGVVLVSL